MTPRICARRPVSGRAARAVHEAAVGLVRTGVLRVLALEDPATKPVPAEIAAGRRQGWA